MAKPRLSRSPVAKRRAAAAFTPGQPWLDSAGVPIEAHGGGILLHEGVYYWYGEDHHLGLGNRTGIHCYSSQDLTSWQDCGVVLPKLALPAQYHDAGACERPKVLYNAATKRFVMWMHLDGGDGYTWAEAGIATAPNPQGPFVLVRRGRPISHDFGQREDKYQQVSRGPTYRDMALFLDDDGSAYVYYASEGNPTMYVSRLSPDFTWVEEPSVQGTTWNRILVGLEREAPAPFKHAGRYHLLSSACTGWGPNPALHARAAHPLGPYEVVGDPSRGAGWETTFQSQPTFVLPAPGAPPGSFIYLADRWIGHALERSSYVWLPFVIDADERVVLDFYDRWSLGIFTEGTTGDVGRPVVKADAKRQRVSWTAVPGADLYRVYANGAHLGTTAGTTFTLTRMLAGRSRSVSVVATALRQPWSAPSKPVLVPGAPAQEMWLSEVQPDAATQGWSVPRLDESCSQQPLQLGDTQYAHGIGTHAVSRLTYHLGGWYGRLTTLAGLNPRGSGGRGEAIFRIYGDGRLLCESAPTVDADGGRALEADLHGVQELVLVVDAHSRGHHFAHADWCEPRLYAAGSAAKRGSQATISAGSAKPARSARRRS